MLRVAAPDVDVASAYAYTLKYSPIQGSTVTALTLTGSVPRANVARTQQGGM